MIMTLNKDKKFFRLHSPAFSHTIRSEARTCKSCHNSSLALGYGRGELTFDTKSARWNFSAKYQRLPYDNLPEDAWIPFLKKSSSKILSTRNNYRPFSVEEQKQILLVGSCFACHDEKDRKLLMTFERYTDYWKKINPNCVVPLYIE